MRKPFKKGRMPRIAAPKRPMPGQNEFSAAEEQAMRQGGPASSPAPQGGAPAPDDDTDPNFAGL